MMTAVQYGTVLREREFMLEPGTVFFNHGSYGAVPKCVHREQIRLREETEQHPDRWYRLLNPRYYRASLESLCDVIGARSEDTVLVENVTTALYIALRTVNLGSKEKILLTSLQYNAVCVMSRDIGQNGIGAGIHLLELPFPIQRKEDILSAYEECLDQHPEIKVAVVDHITSPTAVLMPLKEISAICRKRGVIVIVDGAHACGQLPLNIQDLGVDFYGGNVHKWMFTPRGCGYMWINPAHQKKVRPAIPSHFHGVRLHFDFCVRGTRDDSPYHTIPTAVNFLKSLGGLDGVSAYVCKLLTDGVQLLVEGWGTETLPLGPELQAPFMRLIRIPNTERYTADVDGGDDLEWDLLDMYKIQVLCKAVQGALYIRVSCHVYSCMEDFIKLRDAVLILCAERRSERKKLETGSTFKHWKLQPLMF